MNASEAVVGRRADSRCIPGSHFRWFLGLHLVIATIGSLLLVMEGASKEPFVRFIPSEAISQVGLGCFFMAVWVYIVTAVMYGVLSRRLHGAWLLVVPWAAMVLFYLRLCPEGYVADVQMWVSSAFR